MQRLFIALIFVGCGSGHSATASDNEICEKQKQLCGASGAVECFSPQDWSEMARDLGPQKVSDFRICVVRASSCEAYALCMLPFAQTAK
jgi:hypothetical protein